MQEQLNMEVDMKSIYKLSIQILKFLVEVLRNDMGRMKPDNTNLNCLLLWKVAQNWTMELL